MKKKKIYYIPMENWLMSYVDKILLRIEEEFETVHTLGRQGKPFDMKSAMLNVKPLITKIEDLSNQLDNLDDEIRIQEERRDLKGE